jgi:hypothetical protein
MEHLLPLPLAGAPLLGLAVLLMLVLLLGALWWLRRRRAAQPEQRLRQAAAAMLRNVLVPDGGGGELLLGHVLLTPRGILLVDLRHVDGHVFGGESMQDWTVLAKNGRYTFANPQHPLYDRLAAVRRLVLDVPVEGCIAFTGRARFSRGRPQHVLLFDELISSLEAERAAAGDSLAAFMPYWDRLRDVTVNARLDQLLRS